MQYDAPVLTDHGNVIARTLGTIISSTHEAGSVTGKEHIPGAPAGKTSEPLLGGLVTHVETLNDNDG